MRNRFAVLLFALVSSACSTHPASRAARAEKPELPAVKLPAPAVSLHSPVDLKSALLTLPPDAVAGTPMEDRGNLLSSETASRAITAKSRRYEFSSDNPYLGIHADSRFFLRLQEDSHGRTVAASHASRPSANGSRPDARNTVVYRLEKGRWTNRTAELMPAGTPLDWSFSFGAPGAKIPCAPYVSEKLAGGKQWYDLGKPRKYMRWDGDRFRVTSR